MDYNGHMFRTKANHLIGGTKLWSGMGRDLALPCKYLALITPNVMDNPSNLDGFEGLPLDMWFNQLQSHQENPSSVFPHPSSQPLRDYPMHTNRTMPVTFSMENSLAQVSQSSHLMNSSLLSQYGLSMQSQPEHQLNERSAWTHMMSLDQSLGSYGAHDSIRHMQNRYSPLDELGEKNDSLIKSHPISNFSSINSTRTPFTSAVASSVSESHNAYYQHPTQNSSHEKAVQHLGQLMNLSKASNIEKASHPLTVVTDMNSLESSGEYSPVSPPTTVADKLSISRSLMNQGRVAELLMRENDVAVSYAPSLSSSDPTDIFSYFSKMEQGPTGLPSQSIQDNKVLTHMLHSGSTYNEIPSPSDTPLDMTTAISTKTDKTQSLLPELMRAPVHVPVSGTVAGNDKLPLLHTLLNKSKVLSSDNMETPSDVTNKQQLELSISSQAKLVKPLKSTPKKSNFYGRDASLFSFPSQEPDNDSSQPCVVDESSTNIENKSDSLKEETDRSSGKNSGEKSENSFTDVWDSTNPEDVSTIDLSLNNSSGDNNGDSMFPLNSSDNTFGSGFNASLAQSIDSFIEESTRKTVESDNDTEVEEEKSLVLAEETHNNEIDNSSFDVKMIVNNSEPQNLDNPENEFSSTPPIRGKAKATRGRKRKASGLPPKPRKQPTRKQGRAKKTKAAISHEDETLVNTEVQLEEAGEPVVNTIPKKKRAPPKAREVLQEVTPRRSSSRKSKDNAMRLIEQQADSNYSGFRQADEDEEEEQATEKKSLRSSRKTPVHSKLIDEASDEETIEEKSDDDYVIDEDEAHVIEEDDIFEAESDKVKKSTERKVGGLKISIKLSGNSSAEIVSGISDSPLKKKRKAAKKKNSKAKNKKLLSEEIPAETAMETEELGDCGLAVKEQQSDEKATAESASDATEKHMSLMEKYFSSANSATVARQTQKTQVKGNKMKKKVGVVSAKIKTGRKKLEDSGVKQKSSVKFDIDKDEKMEKAMDKEDSDSNTPKFVCGYCPQRYHSKQDLMTHMEDHMMEMEAKDTAPTPGTDEKKKNNEYLGQAINSRDPRAHRSPTNGSSQPLNKQSMSDKKMKLVVELNKDLDAQSELAKAKFKCGECGEMFTSKPSLLDHVRIHTDDKPFECDICHKCFTERNLLSAHRKTHVPEKLLRCHMCSKAFVDKADLNHHMQSHPKRSGVNQPGKFDLAHKKTFKKVPQDAQDKVASFPPKKPTSFASALSGEIETVDKDDSSAPLVLHLKRGGETSVTNVPKTTSSGSNLIAKSISADSKLVPKTIQSSVPKLKINIPEAKLKVPDKIEAPRTKESEKPNIIRPLSNAKPASNNNKPATSNPPANKTEQTPDGVCNCKECPDCVTRFLQSFD
ncbi:hypothetical protein BgiBS90_009270 [Biomphalaria glabrata]|nr:hypothetical protein BgiBS90_009270 [Biomphalaria glabrata]